MKVQKPENKKIKKKNQEMFINTKPQQSEY